MNNHSQTPRSIEIILPESDPQPIYKMDKRARVVVQVGEKAPIEVVIAYKEVISGDSWWFEQEYIVEWELISREQEALVLRQFRAQMRISEAERRNKR